MAGQDKRPTAAADDPLLDKELTRSREEAQKRRTVHTILMITGWVNVSLGITIFIAALIIAFLSAIEYSVYPCTQGCYYSLTFPMVTSFVLFFVALGEFWAASKLEADPYCLTGMWVSMMLLVPFAGYLLYAMAALFVVGLSNEAG